MANNSHEQSATRNDRSHTPALETAASVNTMGRRLVEFDSETQCMDAVAIIPARLESSRLPRKLLVADTGRPLLQYAWEAAQ